MVRFSQSEELFCNGSNDIEERLDVLKATATARAYLKLDVGVFEFTDGDSVGSGRAFDRRPLDGVDATFGGTQAGCAGRGS